MCVALDPESGRATVVGAGHPPLLVARKNGKTESIASSAPPLGLVERSDFIEADVELERGDAFLLYTDGVYGADSTAKARLTPQTLAEMLQPVAADSHTLLTRLMAQATHGNGDKPLPDDIAAVAVKRTE
jgi:sigma-B regulation protein RsbU (phosphoserine phosphatase)